MKILHIVPSYLPAYGYGGPIQSVHSLNKWLVKKGADVTVYTTNIDGAGELAVPLSETVRLDGVKIMYFTVSSPRRWFYSLDLHIALAKTVREFDIIHITSVFLSASTLGAHYAKKYKKPYIISPRGSLMKEPLAMKGNFKKKIYLSLMEKRNLKGAAAVHFTAEAERREYMEAGLPLKNSFVIPNGFDDERLDVEPVGSLKKKFGIPEKKKFILFLGRLNWKKGLDTLIPSFKWVLKEEPNTVLVLAGSDDEGYGNQIREWMKENGLKEGTDVIFTGLLRSEEKFAALRDSALFVLPSYSENFGMSVIEAMGRTAVVITKEVGISPFVEKYGAGIIVEKNDKKFTEAMLKILKNPSLKEQFKENGRQMVRDEFSMDKVAEAMLGEYNKILKK